MVCIIWNYFVQTIHPIQEFKSRYSTILTEIFTDYKMFHGYFLVISLTQNYLKDKNTHLIVIYNIIGL